MKIGVDLDGVMYSFADGMRDAYERKYGTRPPVVTTWDFWRQPGWDISYKKWHALYRDAVLDGELLWKGEPAKGSVTALEYLVARGHYVAIITHRACEGAEMECRWATEHWLAQHRVPHHSLAITDTKNVFGLDVILEDNLENLSAARQVGERAVCFDQPWNQGWHGDRVYSWLEFVDLIEP